MTTWDHVCSAEALELYNYAVNDPELFERRRKLYLSDMNGEDTPNAIAGGYLLVIYHAARSYPGAERDTFTARHRLEAALILEVEDSKGECF